MSVTGTMTNPSVKPLEDSRGRVMGDLRISVTDRCNFRCLYCLPETEAALNFYRGRWARMQDPNPIVHQWKARKELLTFEEMERVVRLVAGFGISKIRITGGEPLLRQQVDQLVGRLARIPGIQDLAMTSNGTGFDRYGEALKKAGLTRMSFSLDSLKPDRFAKMTGRDSLDQVLSAIAQARELGLGPVKVNAVIIRDMNDDEIESLAAWAHDENLCLRYIEFMPLDSGKAWQKDLVVSGTEILDRLKARHTLKPLPPRDTAETATRWSFPDGKGEIGIVAPVTQPFCGNCNRIRLTSDGKIRTCLFSVEEHDLRSRLRDGSTDQQVEEWLRKVVWNKEAGHRIGKPEFVQPKRTMSCIGG